MVRNLIRNQARSNPLRVRAPCPPLIRPTISLVFMTSTNVFVGGASCACGSVRLPTVPENVPLLGSTVPESVPPCVMAFAKSAFVTSKYDFLAT